MFFLRQLPTRRVLESYQKKFPAMNVDNVQAALEMLRKSSLLMRELDNYFAAHGLSQLRYLIMIVLDREESADGLIASEIAERLDVSRPVMTRTLQGLAEEGMLKIDAHDTDGRVKIIRLTKVGRKKLNSVLPEYYQLIDSFMRRWQ